MSKKILILGNSAREYALAKYLKDYAEVYVAPGTQLMSEFATIVDIRENSVVELLEFVLENGIDLTIPSSLVSQSTDIVEMFNSNNLPIFAPSFNSLKIVTDKAYAKKVLYKLRIPTPKFGVFEKQNMAFDYIKNLNNPFVIKTNEPSSSVIFTSQNIAKSLLDSYFAKSYAKVVIEDYVWGTPFSFYTLTDGYKALPLGSSTVYKYSLEGNGGQLTTGMGAMCPNSKLTIENEYYIMDNVIYPTLDYLEIEGNPYVGILGVNGILTDDGQIVILGYQSFMQDCDCSAILNLLNENFIDIMNSCIVGSFSDEYEFIRQKDFSTMTLVLNCRNKENTENVISGMDNLDENTIIDFYPTVRLNKYLEYEVNNGAVLALTSMSGTLNSSIKTVYQEASEIDFKGIYYRKDFLNTTQH